jgi:hypothetical protein
LEEHKDATEAFIILHHTFLLNAIFNTFATVLLNPGTTINAGMGFCTIKSKRERSFVNF